MNTKIFDDYRKYAETCKTTDYGNKNSVRAHNRAVNKMYRLVEKTAQEGIEAIVQLATLLDEPLTREWLAFQLLDRLTVPTDIENKCLLIIKNIANDINRHGVSMGAQVWLERWDTKKRGEENG